MRGVNVTYPYKELVVGKVDVLDRHAAAVGSVNTVVFEPSGSVGYNTDYTGFIAAYREAFGEMPPGRVALIGAGGVGRAIAFALAELGASELRLFDRDNAKAVGLVSSTSARARVRFEQSFAPVSARRRPAADGVVNATPVGMVGNEGSPVPKTHFGSQRWAFDAVYTPVETVFRKQAEAAGLKFLSGYALFFHQGIDAFQLFTGRKPTDLDAVHRRLEQSGPRREDRIMTASPQRLGTGAATGHPLR